jgi:phosphatidylserine/phosphatidylglycerophosphate/cardiolipin synthase-like enzyme
MKRLLELWAPPEGHRLASLIATTYECQADFVEEEILPVALDLKTPPARGRDFRLELERALQDVEVTLFLHPDRYMPGLRRSPRIDLVPLPERRVAKLHAKVALLRFVPEGTANYESQVVRLIVGSANLTSSGYRSNIEVAIALDDAAGSDSVVATAVRDAATWLATALGALPEQASRQLRDLEAVFAARPTPARRDVLRFVGLPQPGGLIDVLRDVSTGAAHTLTLVSPFWPTGDEPTDVVSALERAGRGTPKRVRLVGAANVDAEGTVRPVMPAALLSSFLAKGVTVEVAAADPAHGCAGEEPDDDDEFGALAPKRGVPFAHRELHAKLLILEGDEVVRLAIGSFNLTRKGLGLHGAGNTEAGLVWTLPANSAGALKELISYATAWQKVTGSPEAFVVPPPPMDGATGGAWPDFLLAVTATRGLLRVEGDGRTWPATVTVRMKDIRGRLVGEDRRFDEWRVSAPSKDAFTVELPMVASWTSAPELKLGERYPMLPDLEVHLSWDGGEAIVPVTFDEKHLFPVAERAAREDERALIDWFLGLRPESDADEDGFGHGIDPVEAVPPERGTGKDILSYLVRDFVHALPGVRAGLAEASMTETGLRTALLGTRSPVALAREVVEGLRKPRPGTPKKTPVATIFELVELLRVVEDAALPELPDGATPRIRLVAVTEIRTQLTEVLTAHPSAATSPILRGFLATFGGGAHATT